MVYVKMKTESEIFKTFQFYNNLSSDIFKVEMNEMNEKKEAGVHFTSFKT